MLWREARLVALRADVAYGDFASRDRSQRYRSAQQLAATLPVGAIDLHHGAGYLVWRGLRPRRFSTSSTCSVVLRTTSGFRLIESIPSRIRYSAISG